MTRVSRAVLISTVAAVLALFVFPSTAHADNCGSLTDCYSTAQAALAALVGLSVLFGVLLSLALDLIPGIGTIKGIIEAITGKDLITGEELAWWERALGFTPVLGALGDLARMADRLGEVADGARALPGGVPPLPGGLPPMPGFRGGPPPPRGPRLSPRPFTPPIDSRTAGTGGIERISPPRTDVFGARSVTIEGTLQDGIPRGNAPNFNREGHWQDLRHELGVPNYEAAHLWGPGFGDEAAAGIMLAPSEVNQVWQSQGAERFLRELGAEARAAGGQVRVTATATSHGSDVRGGDALLAEVTYSFSVVDGAGNVVGGKHVSISVDPPPSGRVHDAEVRDIPPPNRRR
jgi:hypothetical protein